MPSTTIEVCHRYTTEEVQLIEAVQAALVEGFQIPVGDRCVRLVVHEPHRFIALAHLSQPTRYTVISISAFQGRSLEAKRKLYKGIVKRLALFGIPPDHTKIILNEVPRENWGLRGGIPASEIEFNFDINV
ncbi:MAG: tautomerase family protein [Pseudomonadota bacterium]|nr:tautomerase family protein [Pseudomonadota bacterium]